MKKEKAIAALAALAQESRLDVFRMRVQSGPDGLPAGEIGAKLGVPSPTLSFHLNHSNQGREIARPQYWCRAARNEPLTDLPKDAVSLEQVRGSPAV